MLIETVINELKLIWRLILDRRVALWVKGIPLAALLYILSPLDLIPDMIIGLGQLDDLGILLGSLRLFKSMVPEAIIHEHREIIEGNIVDVTDYQVLDGE